MSIENRRRILVGPEGPEGARKETQQEALLIEKLKTLLNWLEIEKDLGRKESIENLIEKIQKMQYDLGYIPEEELIEMIKNLESDMENIKPETERIKEKVEKTIERLREKAKKDLPELEKKLEERKARYKNKEI